MAERKHTQMQVCEWVGLSQSQLSRFLAGGGKRLSRNMLGLCKYAKVDPVLHRGKGGDRQELSQLLSEVIGDNAAAAEALLAVVQALAPVLRSLPHAPASSGEVQ